MCGIFEDFLEELCSSCLNPIEKYCFFFNMINDCSNCKVAKSIGVILQSPKDKSFLPFTEIELWKVRK